MKRKQPSLSDSLNSDLRANTPDSIRRLIAIQLRRVQEAQQQIDKEGPVVRDMKGSVIPHPALDIEKQATKLAAELIAKHRG